MDMFMPQLRVYDVEGLVVLLESLLYKRQKHAVLFLSIMEEGAYVIVI
jgi:hypothetical protein